MSPEGVNIGVMFNFSATSGHRGSQPACTEQQIRLSITTERAKQMKSLNITIGRDVMAQMRWVAGDKVSITINPTKSEATIHRVPDSASVPKWQLLPRSDHNKESIGKCVRASFSMMSRPMMLEAFGMDDRQEYIPEVIVTGPEGITFPLAKQWTVVSRK